MFLIGVPVMGLLLILGPRTLPEYRDPDARRLDLASAAMSLLAILARGLRAEGDRAGRDRAGAGPVDRRGPACSGSLFVRRQLHLESPIIDVRLFRIRAFSASLGTYFLGIFVVVGYFLFIGQYLQLVLGLSPIEAAVWSLPSAVGFIVGSVARAEDHPSLPPVGDHGRRAWPSPPSGRRCCSASGSTAASGILLIVVASIVISLGLAPVITLATELIVGSAPPEQAGAATGMSETSGELGGALGIAILGSIGTAVYRTEVADVAPAGHPGGGRGRGAGHARRRARDRSDAARGARGGARRGGADRVHRRDPLRGRRCRGRRDRDGDRGGSRPPQRACPG